MSAITGSGGNDTLQGTAENDQIDALAGNDTLSGGGGDNLLYGGAGDDLFLSGAGYGAGLDSQFGGSGNDTFMVGTSAGYVVIEGGQELGDADRLVLMAETAGGASIGFTSGGAGNFAFSGGASGVFSQIEQVVATEGDDTINAAGLADGINLLAGAGHDFVTGGEGGDKIDGGAGTDEVFAAGGDDTVDAGADNDFVYGGAGQDLLSGGTGDDYMQGDAGDDRLTGDLGNDFLRGDAGNDFVYGGAGDDSTYGGLGNDQVFGGDGHDEMFGGFDQDTVYGGAGNDTVTGSGQSDLVYGGDGDDVVQGSDGNDTLYGDAGADTLLGMEDADILYGAGGDSVDGGEGVLSGTDDDSLYLTDVQSVRWDTFNTEWGQVTFNDGSQLSFANIERIYVDGTLVLPPDFVVEGTAGADVIDAAYLGDPQGDRIDAADNAFGTDDDLVRAGAGNDSVLSGEGRDTVWGGTGDDTLRGGAGDDALQGEQGNDVLKGEDGHDTLTGGDGADAMYGGEGRDLFYAAAGDGVDGGSTGDDYDVLDVTRAGQAGTRILYDPQNSENGTVEFLDRNGEVTGSLRFSDVERVIACFTPGTLIQTERGEVAVENLSPGDRVLTRDHGLQAIRWCGRRDLGQIDLLARPEFLPVRIKQGALGNNLPERDMCVSPQHRMLIASHRTELLFGVGEVLVAALHMVGLPGIDRSVVPSVSYIHLMFDQHEILLADGTWSESFQPGDTTLDGMDEAQRDEILELFPELHQSGSYPSARMSLRGREARVLMSL